MGFSWKNILIPYTAAYRKAMIGVLLMRKSGTLANGYGMRVSQKVYITIRRTLSFRTDAKAVYLLFFDSRGFSTIRTLLTFTA